MLFCILKSKKDFVLWSVNKTNNVGDKFSVGGWSRNAGSAFRDIEHPSTVAAPEKRRQLAIWKQRYFTTTSAK